MLTEELKNLLASWDVDEEYIVNFEAQKIRKVSTLQLLTDKSLEILFPEEGPRLEFKAHLDVFKEDPSASGNGSQKSVTLTTSFLSSSDSSSDVLKGPTSSLEECFGKRPAQEDLETSNVLSDQTNDNASSLSGEANKTPEHSSKKPRIDSQTLLSVLQSSVSGKLVLAYYDVNSELDEIHRSMLADLCISNFLVGDVNRILTDKDEKKICEKILDLFPKETEEMWLGDTSLSRETSAGRGKLLNRYYNMRRKMMKVKLISPSISSSSKANPSHVLLDLDGITEEEVNDHLLWLENNKIPWMQVLEFWKKTTKVRYNALKLEETPVHLYMSKYPAFSDPQGYILLDADFSILYKGSEMKLFAEWPRLSTFITNKLPFTDKEAINDSFTPDAKKLRTILALNKLFPVVTAIKKNKNNWRPSRQDSRDSLLLLVKTNGDIKTKLEEKRVTYDKYGLKIGPLAVLVGPDEDSVKESYVLINDIMYNMESPMKALDIAFKAIHALDTPYPVECQRELLFLQIAVYGFRTAHDKKSLDSKTAALIKEFENFH